MYIGCFIYSDHGGNFVTRRSHFGIFLFVNNTLIKTNGKRQNTVELSVFVPELVALRIEKDMTVEIRIKLKLFGVRLASP